MFCTTVTFLTDTVSFDTPNSRNLNNSSVKKEEAVEIQRGQATCQRLHSTHQAIIMVVVQEVQACGAGEMAQWVKHFPHKCGDLSSDPDNLQLERWLSGEEGAEDPGWVPSTTPQSSSQLSVTPAPGYPTSSPAFTGTEHVHAARTHTQADHSYT